jgi:hypothetical protein
MIAPEGVDEQTRKRRGQAFSDMLNKGALGLAWDKIPKDLRQSDDTHVVLLDNEDIRIECSPNGSYGYLYICASPKGAAAETLSSIVPATGIVGG